MHTHQDWNIWYRLDGSIDSARLVSTGKIIAEWDDAGNLKDQYNPETNERAKAFFDSDPPLFTDPEPAALVPNWDVFKQWVAGSAELRLVTSALDAIGNSMIVSAMYQVERDKAFLKDVIALWNAAIAQGNFTPTQIQEIETGVNSCIEAANLGELLAVDENGRLKSSSGLSEPS